MALTDTAYLRGMMTALVNAGVIKIASFERGTLKISQEEISDAVADSLGEELPDHATMQLTPQQQAALAGALAELAHETQEGMPQLADQAEANHEAQELMGGHPEATEDFSHLPPELLATLAENQSLGQGVPAGQYESNEHQSNEDNMNKQARDLRAREVANFYLKLAQMGATVAGDGSQSNVLAAGTLAETMQEAARRPAGYANVPAGVQANAGEGAVGTERPADAGTPGQPAAGTPGSPQVATDKSAQFMGFLNRLAQATVTGDGSKSNDLPAATATETKEEAKERPAGYANVPAGTQANVGEGAVGTERPADAGKPGQAATGTPGSPADAVKAAHYSTEFVNLFKNTAQKHASAFPDGMPNQEQVRHVKQMMTMTEMEQSDYMGKLASQYAKTASVMTGRNSWGDSDLAGAINLFR